MVNRTERCHAVLLNLGSGSLPGVTTSLSLQDWIAEHCDRCCSGTAGFCWFLLVTEIFRRHPLKLGPSQGLCPGGSTAFEVPHKDFHDSATPGMGVKCPVKADLPFAHLTFLPFLLISHGFSALGSPCHGHGLLICSVHAGRGICQDEALVVA